MNSLKDLKTVFVSFVVQDQNVNEIVDFYKLMKNIFNSDKNVYFQYYKILDWGIMNKEDFVKAAVWKPEHSNYPVLLKQIKKLDSFNDERIIHSFHGIE